MQQLLLLHGAIGAKEQFNALTSKIDNAFIVHTLNFSGHGGAAADGEFSISRFADDVLDYLDRNNIGAIDIFGYSMGGYVALYLARNNPGRTGKIFTLATKLDWTPETAVREAKMLDAEKIGQKIPAFAKQLELRHAPADWKTVLEKTAAMMLKMGKSNPLRHEDYDAISNEVLIAVGDNDAMVGLEETIAAYRAIRGAALLVIPATAHPIEKIDTDRLSGELKRFFLR